jgi:2-phospho-L-lactate/phosphoenolpyruvate guanylyltransferase
MLTVVIPVREFELGKSRLAGVIDISAREALNRRLFAHVLDTACRTVGAANCLVVSRSAEARVAAVTAGARALVERGSDLNSALDQARDIALITGTSGLVTLSTDLPLLTIDDLSALIAAGRSSQLVIAPDRHGVGTNALYLGKPDTFRFCYGFGSRAAHAGQADSSVMVMRRGLSHDLDQPDELALLAS